MIFLSRHIQYSKEKNEKLLKEGRGQGTGADYVPWIKVGDFSSCGRGNRVPDPKNGRIHHFFSDLEMRFFYILFWDDRNIDIREQYPLDCNETSAIADQLGINHPANQDGSWFVMTTDFLVTRKDPDTEEISFHAYSVKSSSELKKKRVLDKLQIEHDFWEARGIRWHLVTEAHINKTKANNIRKLMSHYADEELASDKHLIQRLFLTIIEGKDKQVAAVCSNFDKEYNLESGTALRLFWHLAARKTFSIDISVDNLATRTVESILNLNEIGELLEERRETINAG